MELESNKLNAVNKREWGETSKSDQYSTSLNGEHLQINQMREYNSTINLFIN